MKAIAVAGAATVDVGVDLAGAATVDVAFDLAGAATVDVAVDLAGAATVDVAFDLAGAATVDVAVDFEVALDLPRHWRCQLFPLSIGNCGKTCLSEASWFFHPNDSGNSWGPDQREGSASAVAFFLVTLFWRSKKK